MTVRLLLFLLLLAGCSAESEHDLIERLDQTDFSRFDQLSFYRRYSDTRGNYLVLAHGNSIRDDGPVLLTIDRRSKQVINVSFRLVRDSVAVRPYLDKMKKMAPTFLELNISGLSVNMAYGTFIHTLGGERPLYAKFRNQPASFKDSVSKRTWQRIKGTVYKAL
jgi:hypothetical protein